MNDTAINGISFRSQTSTSTLDFVTLHTKRTIENEMLDILEFPMIHTSIHAFWTPKNTMWSFHDHDAVELSICELGIQNDIGSVMMHRAELGYNLDVCFVFKEELMR